MTDPAARDAQLAELSDAVCRMGALMLASGTGSYRVKASMGRVAGALGIEELEAQVTLNEIVVTTRAGGSFRTQVVEVPLPAVNADRIGALMRVSLRARRGLTAAKLHRQLDAVEHRRPRYSRGVVVLGALLACMAFAFLNSGGWLDCVAAGIGAGAGKAVQLGLRRVRCNQLVDVFCAATVAGLSYVGLSLSFHWLVPGLASNPAAFTSALLFLVPGFPLLAGALDLARFDFASGMSRMVYVVLIVLAASVGAWLVADLFALPMSTPASLALAWPVLLGLRVLASFLGVFGFALTFNTPPRVALTAALIGAVANVARLSAVDAHGNRLLMAAAATILVGIASGIAGQRILAPRITLSVPAVLIMIPGVPAYRALIAMIGGDALTALSSGIAVVGIVLALGSGLAVARMLSDPAWIQAAPQWTHMPHTHAQAVLRDGPRP